MKRAIIAVVLICSSEFAASQENYLPGYIVKLNKDTLRGFIDYRVWAINPKKIFFKKEPSSDKIQFAPQDIRAFEVSDELYVGTIVKVEVDNPDAFNRQMEFKTDTVFLHTLVNGSKSLYFYANGQSRSHFYIKQDTAFDLLIYKSFLIENSDGNFESKNNRYYGQLQVYLENCPGVTEEIKKLNYKKKDLENLFYSYYKKCTQTEISFKKKTEKTKVEFGLMAGPVLNSITFANSSFSDPAHYLSETTYKPTVGISTGIFAEFTFPALQKRMSFLSEFLYTDSKFSGSCIQYTSAAPGIYTTTTTDIGFSYLKFNNLVRYKYFVGKIQLFIDGGISVGYMIGNQNSKKQTYTYESLPPSIIEGVAIENIKKIEFGYLIGTGARIGKYSLELRYEKGNGVSTPAPLTVDSSTTRLHLLLCYRF